MNFSKVLENAELFLYQCCFFPFLGEFHRIHPEAQRILGNSCIPVVSLERLNFQSVSLSSLQPVVSLQRLPCQKQAELCDNVSLNISEQVQS